jgi:hypothetical protein
VLIANERKDRLALVALTVANLGHEVIARGIDIKDVGAVWKPSPHCHSPSLCPTKSKQLGRLRRPEIRDRVAQLPLLRDG